MLPDATLRFHTSWIRSPCVTAALVADGRLWPSLQLHWPKRACWLRQQETLALPRARRLADSLSLLLLLKMLSILPNLLFCNLHVGL